MIKNEQNPLHLFHNSLTMNSLLSPVRSDSVRWPLG